VFRITKHIRLDLKCIIVSSDARIEKHVTINSILCDQGKSGIVSSLKNIHFICRLAYLADTFQQLNKLNLKLKVQGFQQFTAAK